MAHGKFISYLRVSTATQGKSGLGLEAQREAVAQYLNGGEWDLVEEVIEIESGRKNQRPALQKAIRLCNAIGATLVVAKFDRLSRDAHFLLGLKKSDVKFVAADNPDANELTVGILAIVAENEAVLSVREPRQHLMQLRPEVRCLVHTARTTRLSSLGAQAHVKTA